jgi:hypothetical protein
MTRKRGERERDTAKGQDVGEEADGDIQSDTQAVVKGRREAQRHKSDDGEFHIQSNEREEMKNSKVTTFYVCIYKLVGSSFKSLRKHLCTKWCLCKVCRLAACQLLSS